MKIYIIDYWVEFPSSEYGGVVTVIAEDDKQCYDVIYFHKECEENVRNAISRAKKFNLDPNCKYEAGVVDSFLT
ncbi:MAG: hypothetical protein ACRCU6_08390 [Fusobacteriaceae bacterium]